MVFFLPCGHIVDDEALASANTLRSADGREVFCDAPSCQRWFDVVGSVQPESVREFVQRCEAWEQDTAR